jgi:hypothetical protein
VTTLVDCPESRAGEWNFHVFDIPVRVKIWFWIVILLIGGEQAPGALAIWIAVCFGSILLHELGHVSAFRLFRERAEVVLYGWGGIAIPDRRVCGWFPRLMIALADPLCRLLPDCGEPCGRPTFRTRDSFGVPHVPAADLPVGWTRSDGFGVVDRNPYLVGMFGILAVSSLQLLDGSRGRAQSRPYRSPRW